MGQRLVLAGDRDRDGRADRGDAIRVLVVVTNSGQVPLRSVRLTDSLVKRLGGSFSCGTSVLARGASTTCRSSSVTVTRTQAKKRVFRNEVRATARTSSGALVRSSLSSASLRVQAMGSKAGNKHKKNKHWKNKHWKKNKQWRNKRNRQKRTRQKPPSAKLRLVQYVVGVSDANNNGRLEAGDTVRFGFKVTNAGTLSAEGLNIVGRRLKRFKVTVSCAATQLSPGESTVCTSEPMPITKYQAKKKLGRNFAYAAAISNGEAIRSNSTVITLVRSIPALRSLRLPNTGSSVGAGELGATGGLLLGGLLLIGLGLRRRRALAQR